MGWEISGGEPSFAPMDSTRVIRHVGVHEGLPPGLSAADNALGWQMSLGKLAALVEAG